MAELRTLVIVLGDQLDLDASAFDGFEAGFARFPPTLLLRQRGRHRDDPRHRCRELHERLHSFGLQLRRQPGDGRRRG